MDKRTGKKPKRPAFVPLAPSDATDPVAGDEPSENRHMKKRTK